ncbi:MAG: hypothetical protein ACTHJ0_16455 [Flavipsychrobacter sp.]
MRKLIHQLLFGIALLFTFCPSAKASHANRISKHIVLKNNLPAGTYTLYIHNGNSSHHIFFTIQK